MMTRERHGAWLAVAGLLLAIGGAARSADSFSFIHMSDEHVPYDGTMKVMREASSLEAVELVPYGITAPRPSFIISTGDCTEFGVGKGWWEQYLAVFTDIGLPAHHVPGNHDNTWDCARPRLTALYGAPYHAFTYGGVHFIGLDSASPQDPRPNFGREELLWLDKDLERVKVGTPIILFFHHPPGDEFASAYDWYRLHDVLHSHNANVVAVLVGHGHGVRHFQDGGFDYAMGGSTFGENAGFAIADIRDGRLRIAYRKSCQAGATLPVLDKSLAPGPADHQWITLEEPKPHAVTGATVAFRGTIEGQCTEAAVLLDDKRSYPLRPRGDSFEGTVELTPEQAGGHFYRVVVARADGSRIARSGDFVADIHPRVKVVWRTMLGGSTKSTPAKLGKRLLVGADDSHLHILEARTGSWRGAVEAGGDVLGSPVVAGGRVHFGSSDGKLREVTGEGTVTRTYDAGAPIFAPPVVTPDAILIADATGAIQAVSRRDFHELWRCAAASYTIEAAPFLAGDLLCFGAWDTFVHAVDIRTGKSRWQCAASGTRQGAAAQYYSPADCGPVMCGNRLYIADRKYHLSVVDLATGELVSSRTGVSGTGVSEDGAAVYLRGTENELTKLDRDGKTLWTAKVSLGYVATAPVERNGVVYSVSSVGTVSAVKAATGEVLWTLRVLPGFYALASPGVYEGTVYIAGMDGSVTALRGR